MRLLLLLPLLVVVALVAGCGSPARPTPTPLPPGWTEVPFTSIERNDYGGYNPVPSSEPFIYLLESRAAVDEMSEIVTLETRSLLEELDYAKEIALVITRHAGKYGHYIEIKHLVYHDGTLIVYADYGDPQGYLGAAQDIYPYHAVRVARDDMPGAIENVQHEVETVIVTPTPVSM